MQSKAEHNKGIPYLLFFLWPTLAMLFVTVNFKKAYVKNVIWLFCIFIGLTIILPYSYENHDLVRYRDHFESLTLERHVSFSELFLRPYQHGLNSDLDFYLNIMNILISRITDSFRVFLVIISAVFGYFFSRNLTFFTEKQKLKKIGLISSICLLLLAFLYPVWAINGYRFNTAAMIFLFGLLNYHDTKKNKYLIVVLLTPLIHFSFLLPIAIYGIYFLLGNRFKMYFALVVIAIVFSGVNPASNIYQNASLAPAAYQNKIKGYTEGGYVDIMTNNMEEANWYVAGHLSALKYIAALFLFILFINRKLLYKDSFASAMICYGSLLFFLAILLQSIPAMDRFLTISIYCIVSGVLAVHKNMSTFKNPFVVLLLVTLSTMFLIVKLRIGAEEIGFSTFLFNPFVAPFFETSKSVLDFIKG